MVVELIAFALSGYLDRLRGSDVDVLGSRVVDRLLLALCMCAVAGVYLNIMVVPAIALLMIGMSVSWGAVYRAALLGQPMTDPDWWQFGIFRENVPAALALRGAIWGGPVALLGLVTGYYGLLWFLPAYVIAFPSAVYIARRLPADIDQWAASEWIRGYLAAAVVLVGRLIA